MDKIISNFHKDLKLKQDLSIQVQVIYDSSKTLFEYFEFFMLLHQQFAVSLNFKIPVKKKEFVTFQVFKNEKLSTFLAKFSSQNLCEMVEKTGEFSSDFSHIQQHLCRLISLQKRQFYPDWFFYAILYIFVQKLEESDRKTSRIKELSLNDSKLTVTNRLFEFF